MYRAAPALLIALLIVACGASSPPDTSPTATTGVIGGRLAVDGASRAEFARMTVHVVGTGISTTVGSAGDFVLPNVPAGALELLLSGQGTSVGVRAGEVAGGETVTLTLTIREGRASIDSIARVRGAEATLEGRIEAPGGVLPPNTILVAGRSVTLPAGAGPGLTPGVRVRVTGRLDGPSIIARDIVIL